MRELVCQQCGSPLERKDSKYWYCPYCKLHFMADQDEEGYSFLYQPIEKKTIEGGQIAKKASEIEVKPIAVREFKVNDDIEIEVARDTHFLTKAEAIKAVEAHLGHGEYELASEQINRYLQHNSNCAEILFDSLLCEKRFVIKDKGNGHKEFDGNLMPFTEANKQLLDRALANASPEFARIVMNCCLGAVFSDDESCERILLVCAPYVFNESVYSHEAQEKVFNTLFETVIEQTFPQSFDYLLNTLEPTQVDRYIDYNLRFASKASAKVARKYISNVVKVDASNLDAMRKLVEVDLNIDTIAVEDIIADFENLLRYTSDSDKEVMNVLSRLQKKAVLTPIDSQLVRKLIGYHSKAPDGLENELLAFANKLLESTLFNEAIEYFYLILSFDKKCRDAFFGLCLARIQAKDRNDVVNKNSLLKDCMEFSKCIALYDSDEQDAIYKLSKGQENRIRRDKNAKADKRKKLIRLGILCGSVLAIIIAIIVAVISCNAFKKAQYNKTYSLNNIEMTITKKMAGTKNSSYYDGLVVALYFDIENKSTVDLKQITGVMNVYKGESDLLMTWDVTFSNTIMTAGETTSLILNCDSRYSDDMVTFYNASLEELKITYEINYVYFGNANSFDIEKIENTNGTVKTVKVYNPQDVSNIEQAELQAKEEKYQNALSLMQQGKYDEAYQEFYKLGDYKDSAAKMSEVQNLNDLAVKEQKYQTALSKMQQHQYKEAYTLFSELSDYKNSADKMKEIYNAQVTIAKTYSDKGDYDAAHSTMLGIGVVVDAWNYASQGNWKEAVKCGLVEIVVPEGTTSIASSTFSGCNGLKKVSLPSTLEVIGASAFKNCHGLTSITIPQNVYSIGNDAFSGCYKLVEVYDLSDALEITAQSSYFGKVAYYAKDVFTNASAKSRIFVNSGQFVFYESDTEAVLLDYIVEEADITLPSLASGKQYAIHPYAFYENSVIRNVVIPRGVTEIGDRAFYSCPNLSEVTVGSDVVSIGSYAFYNSTIESITMGSGLLSIGTYVFGNCSNLTTVSLNENLQTIGSDAFYYCKALQKITIPNSVTTIEQNAFAYAGLVYARFENTVGWKASYSSILSSSLSDPANAAKLLVGGNYYYYDWNRS